MEEAEDEVDAVLCGGVCEDTVDPAELLGAARVAVGVQPDQANVLTICPPVSLFTPGERVLWEAQVLVIEVCVDLVVTED